MKKFLLISLAVLGFVTLHPHLTLADNSYTLLAPIPLGGANSGPTTQVSDFSTYVPGVIKLVIALAGALAVIMIVVGGVQYVLSASALSKGTGKEMIGNALIGLLLAVSSWLILNTLNPDLLNFNLSIAPLAVPTLDTGLSTTTPPTSGGTPANGAPVGTNNCGTGCTDANTFNFPKKDPGAGCQGPTCFIDPALGQSLTTLNNSLSQAGIAWKVTEMTPPTVDHRDACHGNGTCVDASLSDISNPPSGTDAIKILTLFAFLDNTSGIQSWEYEACGSTLTAMQNNPVFVQWATKIKCETTTSNGSSGQSFHIEGPNATNPNFGK